MLGLAIILITVWIVLAISAIPLYIAVKVLGGEASILKVIVTNLLVGFMGVLIYFEFPAFSGIITMVALLLIYSFMFKLSIIRAFVAWILQGIVAFALMMVAVLLLGVPISIPIS